MWFMLYSQLLMVMCPGGLVQIWQNLDVQSISAFVDLTGPLVSRACKFLKTLPGCCLLCTFPVFILLIFSNYFFIHTNGYLQNATSQTHEEEGDMVWRPAQSFSQKECSKVRCKNCHSDAFYSHHTPSNQEAQSIFVHFPIPLHSIAVELLKPQANKIGENLTWYMNINNNRKKVPRQSWGQNLVYTSSLCSIQAVKCEEHRQVPC